MMNRGFTRHNAGFTLIEMMVSVALFTIVMVVALGALLGLSEANRKADSLSAAVNNLGAALDDMSRSIRTGADYNCGVVAPYTTPHSQSAAPGCVSIAFLASDGVTETAYGFINMATSPSYAAAVCGQTGADIGCVARETSTDGGNTWTGWVSMTSPDVVVTNLTFYVAGACSGSGTGGCTPDTLQPKVTLLLSGYVAVAAAQESVFNIQTSVTQRLYDQ